MEAELVALASAGATALVQQMVGDGWERMRTRIAAFFAARSGVDAEAVGADLDAARDDLLRAEQAGDEDAANEARDEARVEWRARMRRSLLADPRSADELRAILDELEPQPGTVINNTMSGDVHGIAFQIGTVGRMTNHIGGDGGADGRRS
ncbi:hypothetical protein ACFY7C_14410 [Streptomyces sp. NPDC012769]|uniref:hypothetical protein n=1 Tax=Streptomyces sp. NPDC012769 TaxID=3364848 RepID=UPI00369F8847